MTTAQAEVKEGRGFNAIWIIPIVALLLGVTDIQVPWSTLLLSVVLYVVTPLAAGYLTRRLLHSDEQPSRVAEFTARIKPFSIMGLIATVVNVVVARGVVESE